MNTIFRGLALSLAIAVPAISFAQTSNDALTRVQVEGELIQLEHAGYTPSRTRYPADVEAAEARMAAHAPMAGNAGSAYGGSISGTSQSGQPSSKATWESLYGHH